MLTIKHKHTAFYTITQDDTGWLITALRPPFYNIRYIEAEDLFQITLMFFHEIPKGFQYDVSQGKRALKVAMAKAKAATAAFVEEFETTSLN